MYGLRLIINIKKIMISDEKTQRYIDGQIETRVDKALNSMLTNVKDFIETQIQSRLATEIQKHVDQYFEHILEMPQNGKKKLSISKKRQVIKMKEKNTNGKAKQEQSKNRTSRSKGMQKRSKDKRQSINIYSTIEPKHKPSGKRKVSRNESMERFA